MVEKEEQIGYMMNIIRKYYVEDVWTDEMTCVIIFRALWTCIWPKTNDYDDSL